MEIPVYLKVDTYTSNKPNKNLVHFWRHNENHPNTPLDKWLRHAFFAERHVVNVSENPNDQIEDYLMTSIDNSMSDVENCDLLVDKFLHHVHIDLDNCTVRLNGNTIPLPKDLYGIHRKDKENIAATFICGIANHFRIDLDEFVKIQKMNWGRKGIPPNDEHTLGVKLMQISSRSQWAWKKKWIFLRSENGNVVEARYLPSIKSAAKIAQKYLLENFNVDDKLQWHKNEMFVMNDVSIRLIKATV